MKLHGKEKSIIFLVGAHQTRKTSMYKSIDGVEYFKREYDDILVSYVSLQKLIKELKAELQNRFA